jgi:hypothetical protein
MARYDKCVNHNTAVISILITALNITLPLGPVSIKVKHKVKQSGVLGLIK